MIAWLRRSAQTLRNNTRSLRRKVSPKRHAERFGLVISRQIGRVKRGRLTVPVVGITGSSGKTTTTVLVTHLLSGRGTVQSLAIENTMRSLTRFVAGLSRQSDFVVAEIGASTIGSIRPMADYLRPTVGIITKVGLEHHASFRNKETVALEKRELVAALPENGLAVLNRDDPLVMGMVEHIRARVVTFGWSESADYRVVAASDGFPETMRMTIACSRGTFDILTPFMDSSFWLATAAAFACAVELGVDPSMAAKRVATCTPANLRLQRVETEGGPTFILDTAKAPAESIEPTFAFVGKARAPFKTIILGVISDYAGNPRKQYRNAFAFGRTVADRVIFVGDNIHRSQATDEDKEKGIYAGFHTPREVSDHIRATAKPGELILVKGSKNLHLERIGLSWVTPVRCWEPNCGKSLDCMGCGMLAVPYKEHGNSRRAARRSKIMFWKKRPKPTD